MSSRHLDEDAVLAFAQGKLPPDGAREAEAHLDGCVDCRTLLAHVSQMLTTELIAQPSLEQSATEPDFTTGAALPPGQVLAKRFRVVRVLGRGAMGQVYEAMDEHLKVPIAVKLLVPRLQDEPSFLDDLHREIVVARKITHPNVCRVYDLGSDGPLSFITMEMLEGETLERVLAKRRLPRAEVGRILEQVCWALEAAHQEGVVHRDLKPGNIMIDPRGKVTVMDFGLARDLTGTASVHQGPIGTPAYWAPEQARGEPTTFRSDIYAVGAIGYEMFRGQRLAHGLQNDATFDEIPPAYLDVLRKCLEVDPNQRFGSANALKDALEVARASLPEPRRRGPRKRFVMALGVSVGFLLAFIVAQLVERVNEPPPRRSDLPAPPLAAASPTPAAAPPAAIALESSPPAPRAPEPAPIKPPPKRKPRPAPSESKPLDGKEIPIFQ